MSWTMVWFATWPAWETFWARHAQRLSRLLLRTPQPDMGVAWHNFSFQNLFLDGFSNNEYHKHGSQSKQN